jgi:hypothetical protein
VQLQLVVTDVLWDAAAGKLQVRMMVAVKEPDVPTVTPDHVTGVTAVGIAGCAAVSGNSRTAHNATRGVRRCGFLIMSFSTISESRRIRGHARSGSTTRPARARGAAVIR